MDGQLKEFIQTNTERFGRAPDGSKHLFWKIRTEQFLAIIRRIKNHHNGFSRRGFDLSRSRHLATVFTDSDCVFHI